MKQIVMLWHRDPNNPITLHLVKGASNAQIYEMIEEMCKENEDWVRWFFEENTLIMIRDLLIKVLTKLDEEISNAKKSEG
jgi:hypothetical protein